MALLNIFKKKKDKISFEKKQGEKTETRQEDKVYNSAEKDEKTTKASVLAPHITEKSTLLKEKGVYVFKVKPNFNKIMVKAAVKSGYGVNPVKVTIVNVPPKKMFIKRRQAIKPGFKKAVVYLKEGDKITI